MLKIILKIHTELQKAFLIELSYPLSNFNKNIKAIHCLEVISKLLIMDYELEKFNIKVSIFKTVIICITLVITLIYITNRITDTIELDGCKSRMAEVIFNEFDINDFELFVEGSEELLQTLCESTSD